MVKHKPSQRIGEIVCGTSDHADGSPRVLVEWLDGTEGEVVEAELEPIVQVYLRRTHVTAWI